MRGTIAWMILIGVCTGCGKPAAAPAPPPGGTGVAQQAQKPVLEDVKVAANAQRDDETKTGRAEPVVVPPAMSKEEIVALVKSLVAEELARHQQQQSTSTDEQALRQAQQERAAAEAAEQAAAQAARETAQREAEAAATAAARDEQEVARFLLLPDELDRVERIKEKLKAESIWGLSPQDLDFAVAGFAAPLLHDSLFAAAARHDPNVELDMLAEKSKLTTAEKIELATMPPMARQQLLGFTQQFRGDSKPSPAADRYIREYVNRYPFIRKVLLEYLRDAKPSS